MSASPERIREVVERYVALVGTGTADEIVALYAEDATVEDPIGSDVRTGHAAIREFYATLEGLDQETRLITARIGGGQAAFHFEIVTKAGEKTYTLSPIDVMTFDDDGVVTSMRAYWADTDMVVG
ncbi:nuclear transport factor 2 family protein [Nocardioides mangrovi]|uniref:Nuclear transport factor 2 family protein n=1 Tax=Nocardioides mangrovi TaxID=2874580 RepID=A0ABS7UDB7_9ACTN|nr:nuclear transport factor 2 family protein [Nocardioides mangrovi]MBZ5738658.1 nuclear transport factor 2 family protein [Nocardioides mangrovi]